MTTTNLTSDEREHDDGLWFNEWPSVNGFYWLRGWRHYGDLPISVDGDSFWMMFNLARNHRADLDDSEDVQFLGPITPYSAVTAATRMRDKCVKAIEAAPIDIFGRIRQQDAIKALESLTLDQMEQETK